MPQNMQHRPKVAQLEIEEAEGQTLELETEAEKILSDDEFYDAALKYLKRGMKQKDVENHLVGAGLSRIKSKKLVKEVWAKNPEIQRTNTYILLGTGVFFMIPGVLLFLLNAIDTGSFPLFTPSYILILLGTWFLYKGVKASRKSE